MLNIENQLVLKIEVDGKEMPVEHLSVTEVQLSENDRMGLPIARIVFGDPVMWMKRNVALCTGLPINITVGRTLAKARTYKFKLFNFQDVEQQATIVYTLLMTHVATSYLTAAHTASITGTSFLVLSEIAKACGLLFDGKATLDRKTWTPLNKVGFKWATDVASKGFVNGKSCMRVGVTLDGVMRYRDIMDVTAEDAKAAPQFLHGADKLPPKAFMVWAKSFFDISGQRNATGAAKAVQQDQKITGASARQEKVTLTRKSENSSVPKATPNVSRVDAMPVDAGNGHDNFSQAIYQNSRLFGLQSVFISLVVLDHTEVSLYDLIYVQVIDVHNADGTPVQNPDQSGVYTVVGKTIYVSPTGQYVEKLVACREGNNGRVDGKDERK